MNIYSQKDTIAAISTPLGEGGIGIVRISGDKAIDIAERIFILRSGGTLKDCISHTVNYGDIIDPDTGTIVDEVLVAVMRAPMTYTAEDVIEINCHGGIMLLKKTLDICIKSGARAAEPGEFTKRAFLNGRIDLSQAEAVIDMINARSDSAHKVAIDQLKGVFSEEVEKLRGQTLDLLSLVELSIDFIEEDVDFASDERFVNGMKAVLSGIKNLIAGADKGMIYRHGIKVVIAGKTNVGKSSLMNALLKDDRVIVTSVSGTTRDVIEETLNMNGIGITLSDTAGIIDTEDEIEKEGIERSKSRIEAADLVLFMIDPSRPLDEHDSKIYELISRKKHIIVINKADLPKAVKKEDITDAFGAVRFVEISALTGMGIIDMEDAITDAAFGDDNNLFPEGPVVANARHKEALERALKAAARIDEADKVSINLELLASDLNEIIYELGIITGQSAGDDVLDRIFANFCIGK